MALNYDEVKRHHDLSLLMYLSYIRLRGTSRGTSADEAAKSVIQDFEDSQDKYENDNSFGLTFL